MVGYFYKFEMGKSLRLESLPITFVLVIIIRTIFRISRDVEESRTTASLKY